jgi:hypothetical protein
VKDMDNAMIEEIVKEVLKSLDISGEPIEKKEDKTKADSYNGTLSKADYPLAEKGKTS